MKITSLIKSKIFSIFSHKILFCSLLLIFASFSHFGVEYKTISSSSTLSWFDESSWQDIDGNGTGDIPDISGNSEVSIVLNADMVAQSSDQNPNKETIILHFNSEGSKEIHIYLNGYEVNVKNAIQIGKTAYSTNGGNLILHGNGSMSTEVLEFGKGSQFLIWRYPENKLYLKENAEFYVNSWVSPYQCKAEIYNADGKFYLNASGLNINWYENVQINFNEEPIPYGEQTFFKIIDKGGNPFDTGKTISFERNAGSTTIEYEYSVEILGTNATWTLETQTLSNGGTYSVSIPGDSYNETKLEQKLSALGTLADGDGIIITFRTPDGKMDMCEIRYIEGELLWTGAASTNISDTRNWSYDEIFSEGVLKEAIIGSGAVNYPEITGDVTVSKLTVKNGARITVAAGGVLTVNDSLIFEGNSKIDASAGKVIFSGENSAFSAKYPEFSSFGTLEVTENATFETSSDLHITTALTNNGSFSAGKVYFEINETSETATITGKTGDSSEIAEKTKIAELYCENQANKNLKIINAISVGNIYISGKQDTDGNRLSVTGGTIYLENDYEDAKYLVLSDYLPTIKNGYITASKSKVEITDKPAFSAKNWKYDDGSEYPVWKGTENTDWNNENNWNFYGVPTADTNDYVVISANGQSPIISSGVEIKKLLIQDGANLSLDENGELTISGSLNCAETGNIDASEGTVIFTGTGTAENPSFEANDSSIFGKLRVAENAEFYSESKIIAGLLENNGTFTTKSDLHITNVLTNNGTFTAETVYVEPSETATIIESAEIANQTKIQNLNCADKGGKTLVINGTISVEKISLSGAVNSFLTVKTSDSENSGKIYLDANCDANYLSFEKGKVVSIQNKVINVTKSDMTNIKADVVFKSEFVEKNWRYADQTEFIWTGKNNVKWTDSKNWDFYSVPSDNAQSIIIPNECVKYPILDENINLRNSSLIIETGASIDFAGQTVTVKTIENGGEIDFAGSTVNADSITNNGTVKLTGNETFKKQDDTKTSLNNGEASTVIYYGTNENAEFVWGGSYEKLIIEEGFSGSFAPSGTFQSSTSFSVANSIEVENGKVFTKKDATKDYVLALGGAVKIENKSDSLTIDSEGDQNYNFDIEFEKSVVLKSNGSINFPANSEKKFKNGLTLETTKDFSNAGNLISENGDINITSASFENASLSELSAKSGKITISATGDFENTGTITAAGNLVINQVVNFTNTGNITASGVEIDATGDFKNEGNLISENGEISITSANFENAQSSELSANIGKMTITATSDFTNAGTITVAGTLVVNQVVNFTNTGNITALGVEIVATGDFTNSGTIYSTAELLKITAKAITTSGEIKAQSGELTSKVGDVVFTENSASTFIAGLTVTSAGNFENCGNITASGIEIEATGNFKNEGSFISENGDINITSANFENAQSSEISAKSGKMTISATGDFTNAGNITAYEVEIEATGNFTNSGNLISENGDINITSANFENTQSGELSANTGKITISATGDFTNAGTITAAGKLVINPVITFTNTDNITASGVEIVATGDFTNSGKFISENGDINIKSANFENAQSSELSANTGKMTITATGNFTNSGKIDSSSELLKITAKAITTSGEIKANSGEFISTESDILFGENSENTFEAGLTVTSAGNFENCGAITASGIEIVAIGNFKNEGSFISENGDINITSASFENSQSSELSANTRKMTISATSDVTNAGVISAYEVEIEATGNFTNSGKIDSSSELLKITAKSITTSGEIKANSGEFISTESDILFGENSENTFEAGLTVTSAGNFENCGAITALGVEIVATGDFTNAGKIDSSSELLKITAKTITTSGEIKANSGEFISTESDILFAENSANTFIAGLTVTSAGNFENCGNITALGVEIGAAGDFTNSGTIDSSSELLKIIAKSITTFGEINAQSGEFESTEAGIVFGGNSENTFEAGLTVTSAGNFENSGTITAFGVEIEATGDFTNAGTITAAGTLVVNQVENFTNTGNITASGVEIVATGNFKNEGSFISENGDINITSANFENAQSSEILAKSGKITISATGDFTNAGTITAESGAISITAKTFTNAEGKTISAKTGFSCVTTETFTNTGNITTLGFEVDATGDFTNAGTIEAGTGDISVTSSSFENNGKLSGTSGTIKAETGNVLFSANSDAVFTSDLTVECTNAFTNAGTITAAGNLVVNQVENFTNSCNITALGVEIGATGDFTNSGKIDSSTGLLKITAKSITTFGEIKANSGEFISTETDILFGENSETSFEAGLTVTSAGNFENSSTITASGIEIVATGNFTNSGSFISENGDISIKSANFENASLSEIYANTGKITISATSDFTNAGTITAAGNLVINQVENFTNTGTITAFGVEIEATSDFTNSGKIDSSSELLKITAKSITTSGEINAQSGDFGSTETDILFGENSETIFEAGLTVTSAGNFENYGTITAFGVEIEATGDFTNAGKIDSSSELLKITAKSITTSGEIKANSGEFISTESDILFAENSASTFIAGLTVTSAGNFENSGTITASGIEIVATGNFKNEGSFISENGDINITSANFENAQSSEISANTGKMTISATSDFTNAGTITAAGKLVINQVETFTNSCNITTLGVEIGATGDFTNSGKIDSSSELLKITAKSITTSGEIKANRGEFISTESDILFAENSASTFEAGLTVTSAGNFKNSGTITAFGVEIVATGDFTNSGKIDSSSELLKITAKSITTSGEIKAQSGELTSKVGDVVFAENSASTFIAGLTVTSAGNFENCGTITASGLEIEAIGNFKNEGSFISENGDISIISANFENASLSELSANKDFVCNVTESFSNAGIITSASGKVDINTKSFINKNYNLETPAKIKTENGLINVTTRNFENSGDISAYLDFTCAEPEIFTNAGTITSETGKIDVKAQIMENPGSLFAINGKIDIFTELFETTKEIFGKNIDINSQSSIFAGLVKSGAGDIYISSDLLITHPVEFCLGGSLIIGTVKNPKNLVISSLDKNQNATEVKFSQNDDLESIETKVIVSGYAIIFNGNVTLSTNIDIANDFVLLNGITSGENSIYRDSITEIDGLFAYNLFGRGYFDFIDFPSDLPFSIEDNKLTTKNLFHEKYNTHFSIAEGKIISVGKNFYCNGVDLGLNTSAEWFIKIPGNDVATSAFAECYNASIKNCKVAANTNPEDYAWLSTENAKDETGNTNVAFSKAVLSSTEVSTISDNIIFIKFIDELNGKEIKIENSCNEISAWLENFRFNVSGQISEDNPGIQFTGVYENPECTESTDGKGDLSTFYLKYEIPTDGSIDYRWNTDAIGNSYGSEESTDSSGNYKKVIPNIAFERALTASYAGLRDEHKNRLVSVGTDDIGSNPLFLETKDKASPVLIAVTLGQEQHETDASSQHHYDSHNFIDWQFSEPVEFENYPKNGISQIDSVDTSANSENIQATATFGKITNQGNGFVVAGLGSFSSGKITTGSKTGLGEVNAFYRNFALDVDEKGSSYNSKIKPTRLRLSIAGYVEEENPINYKGEIYNNWLGFIDSKNTTIPSGTFTMPSLISTSIIDKRGNRGEAMEQTVSVNDFLNRYDKEKTLYGTWDIDSPVVSSYMKENLTTIEFEEVIPVDFSQSLSAQGLEIHFLDNSSYNQFEGYSNWKWRTKIGWLNKNESTEITLPLDNKGGSRMTFAENKTGGGLRLSSIVDSIEALSCKNLDLEKAMTFTTDFSQSTTYEAFFGKSEDLAFDVPYLSLRFSELSKEFSLNNNYELLYSRHDSQGNPIGFITDLAGNLLYDFTVNSPDKNPPKIFLSIGAVHKDKLYIMFSKKLDWKDSNGNPDEGKLRRIVKSLSIFDSKGNDTGLIDYKKGSRTKIVTETEKSTGIEISLTRTISYEELKNLYIGVNVFDSRDELIAGDGDKSKEDSISGEHGNFSMLYDLYENPVSKDLKHCLSDFAVNALDVLYAYDGRVADEAILAQGVYGGNQWTVTNFTENKDNSSQIISDKDISIVSKIKDPSSLEKQDKFSMIADISPNLQSTGSDFEIYTTINPRLWFTDYIKFFSTDPNNSEYIEKDNIGSISGKIENIVSGDKNQNITFVLPNHPKNENSLGWGAGNEIQFLFKVFDEDGNPLMVDGNQDGDFEDDVDHPLFAVRLKDENDLTSIDLWSLNIVDILRQKGGVTILNNVINPLNSEECAIEITIPKAGNLTVQVLTLDGNVVKVIQRGRVEEGTYYYKWNGKNISGDSVARGMYFIRVVGPNIEETRKVMVVW